MDLAIDPLTGDLTIENGNLATVEGIEAIAQHLKVRLRFFVGSWRLNPLEGIPFYDRILVKNPNYGVISVLFRNVILATPGVAELINLELDLDKQTRRLSLTFEAITDLGLPLVFEDFVL